MKKFAMLLLVGFSFVHAGNAFAGDGKEVACVSTTFHALSPNDKICIKSFHDETIPGVTCYVSRAITGGWKGAAGFAEDPSRFSIACNQTGAIDVNKINSKPIDVFVDKASLFAKDVIVKRTFDLENKTLIYLVYSTKIIDGSPYNAISVVPVH